MNACSNCRHFDKWLWQVCAGSSVTEYFCRNRKHPYNWHYHIFSLCQHSSFHTLLLGVRIIQFYILNLQKTDLLLWGKYFREGWVLSVRLCYWEGLLWEVSVTAARLTWGAAQAGPFDWTPGRAHALSPSELNLASSWLKAGVLSLLECLSFISTVNTKQYTAAAPHPTTDWFYSLTWPHSIPYSVVFLVLNC